MRVVETSSSADSSIARIPLLLPWRTIFGTALLSIPVTNVAIESARADSDFRSRSRTSAYETAANPISNPATTTPLAANTSLFRRYAFWNL